MPDRAALVTGASSGIGLAIAHALGEEGHGLTVAARRPEKLAAAAEELRAAGHDVGAVAANLTEEDEIQRVVAASGYRLVISSTGDAEATVELVRSLRRGFVDGMVLSPLRVTDELIAAIAEAPVPVVVLGQISGIAGADAVRADSSHGMELVIG